MRLEVADHAASVLHDRALDAHDSRIREPAAIGAGRSRRGRQDDPALQSESQFNRETLPESLAIYQIAYAHMAEFGGLRGRQRRAEPSPNAFWSNESFRNYADYALTESFRRGLERLRDLGR